MRLNFIFVTILLALSYIAAITVKATVSHEKLPLTKAEKTVIKNDIFHKPPLFYYREYVEDRVKINPKLPLKEHYARERALRKKHYSYLDQINKLRQELQFHTNDIKHSILKSENAAVKELDLEHGLNLRIAQRHTAVKFQIDHDIAWKTFYEFRMKINEKKLLTAMPDQLEPLNKMIAFDKERSAFYESAAEEQWEQFKELKEDDNEKSQDMNDDVNSLANKILKMKMQLHLEASKLLRKIHGVEKQDGIVMNALKADEVLDMARVSHEQNEQRVAEHSLMEGPITPENAKLARETMKYHLANKQAKEDKVNDALNGHSDNGAVTDRHKSDVHNLDEGLDAVKKHVEHEVVKSHVKHEIGKHIANEVVKEHVKHKIGKHIANEVVKAHVKHEIGKHIANEVVKGHVKHEIKKHMKDPSQVLVVSN